MGLFREKTQEDEYLEAIAKCDKRLIRDRKLLPKMNNSLSKKMLENNIKLMERTRERFVKLLSNCRNEIIKADEHKVIGKCNFCNDKIERQDLLEYESKPYHSWCKQHINREDKQ